MVATLASAIVSGISALGGLGMGIWSNLRAKNAKTEQVGVSGGEQAALSSARYTADRLSELGGLSAAQTNRMMQMPDVQAQQTQQAINQLATTPFQDAYQREAFAKVMLSGLHPQRQNILETIAQIDTNAASQAYSNAFAAQSNLAKLEADAQKRRDAIIARNEQIQANRWNNFANMIGGVAKFAGMSAEGIETYLKEMKGEQTAQQEARAAAFAEAEEKPGMIGQVFVPQVQNINTANVTLGMTQPAAAARRAVESVGAGIPSGFNRYSIPSYNLSELINGFGGD